MTQGKRQRGTDIDKETEWNRQERRERRRRGRWGEGDRGERHRRRNIQETEGKRKRGETEVKRQ